MAHHSRVGMGKKGKKMGSPDQICFLKWRFWEGVDGGNKAGCCSFYGSATSDLMSRVAGGTILQNPWIPGFNQPITHRSIVGGRPWIPTWPCGICDACETIPESRAICCLQQWIWRGCAPSLATLQIPFLTCSQASRAPPAGSLKSPPISKPIAYFRHGSNSSNWLFLRELVMMI